jgi:hypothetical protein
MGAFGGRWSNDERRLVDGRWRGALVAGGRKKPRREAGAMMRRCDN